MVDKATAQRAAEELAATLKEEFGVEWENFGWHMSVDYGYLKVRHFDATDKYHTYILGQVWGLGYLAPKRLLL